MSPKSKHEYVTAIYKRYKKANRKQKSAILNEFCTVCKYHRKWAIEKLNTFKFDTPKEFKDEKRGRPPIYKKDQVLEPLKRIWLAAHCPCSKHLKIMIPQWLPGYHEEFGSLSIDTCKFLLKISAPTIDRLLKPIRTKHKYRGFSATKPGTLLRKSIPIKVDQWNEFQPGFIESDTVHHCGSSMSGQYALTVDCVDIATGWTEQRATWGTGAIGVLNQIKHIETSLPFKLLGFDSDSGGEFINQELVKYFLNRNKNPVQFTRSRAYHKDDNAHIEQKNWTHVRQWLGYYRFDNPLIVDLLNELYTSNDWRFLHNFFVPSVKLISKQRIGSKIIKKHDAPKTPVQRILESKFIDLKTKNFLKEQSKNLNPFQLRKGIEIRLKAILKLASPP